MLDQVKVKFGSNLDDKLLRFWSQSHGMGRGGYVPTNKDDLTALTYLAMLKYVKFNDGSRSTWIITPLGQAYLAGCRRDSLGNRAVVLSGLLGLRSLTKERA